MIVNRGLLQELSSQHQYVPFTVSMFANEHDADETRLHLTLDASQKVTFTDSCLSTWCTNHLLHKAGKQICSIVNSFQGGNRSRAQTAQRLQQQRPACQTKTAQLLPRSPSPQYMKETLQWFLQGR